MQDNNPFVKFVHDDPQKRILPVIPSKHTKSLAIAAKKYSQKWLKKHFYPAVDTGASVDMSGAGASAKLGNTPLVKLVLSAVTLLMEILAKVAL